MAFIEIQKVFVVAKERTIRVKKIGRREKDQSFIDTICHEQKTNNCDHFTPAMLPLMTLVFLVRSGNHAREHREQRCPRSGGYGGRFTSTRGCHKRSIIRCSG